MQSGIRWVEADLSTGEPDSRFDLVTTHCAHPATPQLAFYERISHWVAPGGTLMIVGHLHSPGTGHVAATLGPADWNTDTVTEQVRAPGNREDSAIGRHDVVVRATRRSVSDP